MDLKVVLLPQDREQEEAARLDNLQNELALFDLDGAYPSPPYEGEEEFELPLVNQEHDKQISFSPQGIAFFKSDMFSLYTEDSLVWQDSFHSSTVRAESPDAAGPTSILFAQAGNSRVMRNKLLKYLFHIMCCTSNPNLRDSSCNRLHCLPTTFTSLSCIKKELYLALLNLGGDVSSLKEKGCSYRSCVMPPPSTNTLEAAQLTDTQLCHVLFSLFRVLSRWLPKYNDHTIQDIEDLLLLFIRIGLDPKVIDEALDRHICTCIAHTLNLYPTDEEFSNRLRNIVQYVLDYCDGDLSCVVYLCQAYISMEGRGKTLQCVLAFHQLRIHLDILDQDFVTDVQAKDVADLLCRYFQTCPDLKLTYDTFYVVMLIDLSLRLDLIQPHNTSDLETIHDLIKQNFYISPGSGDNLNPTISYTQLSNIMSKWKAKISTLAKKDDILLPQEG